MQIIIMILFLRVRDKKCIIIYNRILLNLKNVGQKT